MSISMKILTASACFGLLLSASNAAAQEDATCRVTQAKQQYAKAHNEIVKQVHKNINESSPLEELNFGELVTQCIGSYGLNFGSLANLADAIIDRVEDAARSKCSEIKDYLTDQASGLQGSFDAPFDLGTITGEVTTGQGWGVNSELDPEEYKKRSMEVWNAQKRRLEQVRNGIYDAQSAVRNSQSTGDFINRARTGYENYESRR
ncbi:hypothetical protein [Marinobacter sp. MBR-105]|jgi:hypothetical protein